jgi:hypothetical protein
LIRRLNSSTPISLLIALDVRQDGQKVLLAVKNILATLTNYIDAAWSYGVAWNYEATSPTFYFEGQVPAAGTLQELTMLDNSGLGISSATIDHQNFLWFQDFGSACGRAGAPPC